jgi:hypothetical protein
LRREISALASITGPENRTWPAFNRKPLAQFKEFFMRKIMLVASIAAAALSLSACSESTEEAADAAVDGAAADTAANADAMGEAVEGAAVEAGAAVEEGADAVVAGGQAAGDAAEAEVQDESVAEANAD